MNYEENDDEINETNGHHVAWADRIGLNKQWARDIQTCSETFGTNFFPFAVKRFLNNIPNIREGPQLNSIISEYRDKTLSVEFNLMLDDWKIKYPDLAINQDYVDQKSDEISMYISEKLYHYIIQTLEDNGFGFYASNVEEDEMN